MIHFGFNQYDENNNITDKLVQVDILLTYYPEFCKFYMYSPTELESKYKGAHRNELLRAIAYVESYSILAKDMNNEPVIWEQDDLSSNGFWHDTKTLIDEQGNRLKYKNTDEDLIPAYAKIVQQILISHNPSDVIHMLVRK
jgi:hypothetical protein